MRWGPMTDKPKDLAASQANTGPHAQDEDMTETERAYQERKRALAQSITQRVARGNLSLQAGRCTTEADVEAKRRHFAQHEFKLRR